MIAGKTEMRLAAVAALALASVFAHSQSPLLDESQLSAPKPAAVAYLYPQQVTVPANQPTTLALHFRVAPGLHINSHMPSEAELIPATLTIPESSGVRIESAIYPHGIDITLPLDLKTRINVYTGDFVIQARIVAAAGNHLVEARLRYQACDNNACMPPKTITAPIEVIAR
jgi:hypothetical protein